MNNRIYEIEIKLSFLFFHFNYDGNEIAKSLEFMKSDDDYLHWMNVENLKFLRDEKTEEDEINLP